MDPERSRVYYVDCVAAIQLGIKTVALYSQFLCPLFICVHARDGPLCPC